MTKDDRIEVTPAMIEAGVEAAWQEAKPPAFVAEFVRRKARREEAVSGVSARRQ